MLGLRMIDDDETRDQTMIDDEWLMSMLTSTWRYPSSR